MNDNKPRYNHDCSDCKFLGQFKEFDLYFCDHRGPATVISRYGNEPSAYNSGLGFSKIDLIEAECRAVKEEFLREDQRSWLKAGHPEIPEHAKTPAMKFQDKRDRLKAMFGTGAEKFVDDRTGLWGTINICGLDTWIRQQFGDYDADGNTSMHDFVSAKFGEEASKWIVKNLKGLMF